MKKNIMKYVVYLVAALPLGGVGGALLTSCQDKDIEYDAMKLNAPDKSLIVGQLQGDDYILTWPAQTAKMQISTYRNGTFNGSQIVEGTSFTHANVPTNVPFEYVFKLTDGTNFSKGVVLTYTRPGATSITGVQMRQVEKSGGYDAIVEWNAAVDAEKIIFKASNGAGRDITETLPGTQTSYTISDVLFGEEWTVTVTASNDKGAAIPTASNLKIGKTAIGFLSTYATPEALVADGDDDEASAWLWLHEQYPTAQFIPFSTITSTDVIDPYRVLFWLRDVETNNQDDVWNMPADVEAATPIIRQWYKEGGNMLLWSHATVYVGVLGRVNIDEMKNNDRSINCGEGGINDDVWRMAVQLNPGSRFSKDHSTHPIYKGLEVQSDNRTKLIAFKGPGWTEDHNCLFFNLPSLWTGIGNQEEACYAQLTQVFGVYPLGTWDSQIDWVSQLNVWEAQQGISEFKGTLLMIGNGGCEFSMKNRDGSPDKSAHPSNNIYQDNVLGLAKNSLEYLKTR